MAPQLPPPLPAASANPEYVREDRIKQRYVEFVRSSSESHVSVTMLVIAFLLIFTGVLIPVSIGLAIAAFRTPRSARQAKEEWLAFAQRSRPVMAYPLMVNSVLLKRGSSPAPGLVIMSFDPAAASSVAFMSELAMKVGEAESEPADAHHQFAVELMSDEEYQPHRRRKLPESLTGGPTVYACDLAINPAFLEDRHIWHPFLPCMAEPGDTGRIELIPWWLCVEGGQAPA